MRTYYRLCVLVASLLAFGFVLPLVPAQQPKVDPKSPVKMSTKPQLAAKVFKLERADPEAITGAMNLLLEDMDMEVPVPMPAAGSTPLPTGGGMLGMGGTNFVPVWRATIDLRTKSVVVRGSERHLKVAADLVAVLDRAANAPLPQTQIVKAFALKNANAEELAGVIRALEFEDLRLASPDEKLLVAVGPDEATKAIAELVKELDVPAKPDPEPKKEPEKKE